MGHSRINRGLFSGLERRALHWLAERTPESVKPDHLTALGVAGAVLATIGFAAARLTPFCVGLVVAGLFLNWFGDSLDGTIARYRKVERPLFGYFIDHSCDLISQTIIFLGFGLSPYFTFFSALLALSMYLLMSSYTYLKVTTLKIHQLSYGGMGATELRIALAGWALVAALFHVDVISVKAAGYPVLDEVVGALSFLIFLGFIWMVRSDVAKFRRHFDQHDDKAEAAIQFPQRLPSRQPIYSATER